MAAHWRAQPQVTWKDFRCGMWKGLEQDTSEWSSHLLGLLQWQGFPWKITPCVGMSKLNRSRDTWGSWSNCHRHERRRNYWLFIWLRNIVLTRVAPVMAKAPTWGEELVWGDPALSRKIFTFYGRFLIAIYGLKPTPLADCCTLWGTVTSNSKTHWSTVQPEIDSWIY